MIFENIAFLIPTHRPHYEYIYSLLNKLKNNNIHINIYLVFSNIPDYFAFSMKSYIHPIIPEPFKTDCIVTYKKFFGLNKLKDSKYDYIICCDSEIDIICDNFTNENLNQKIRQIFDTKKIYAGDATRVWVSNITKECADAFPEKYEDLKTLTNNFSMYFWWSDLPVYKRTDIDPFLSMIKNNKHSNFDYIMYQYYLILFHGFEIINTTPITNLYWSLENLYTSDITILNRLLEIKYGFSWITKKFYSLNKEFVESQKGFLIYHLDR